MIMNNLMLLPESIQGFYFCTGIFSLNEMNSTMHFLSISLHSCPILSFFTSIAFSYCTFFHSLAGIQIMNMRMTLLMGKGLISKGLFTSMNSIMKRIWKMMICLLMMITLSRDHKSHKFGDRRREERGEDRDYVITCY